MFKTKLVLSLLIGLLANAMARADGYVILDHRGFADTVTGFAVDEGGRLYASVLAGNTCGILGTDASGTLLANFGDGGRLPISNCATQLMGEPGGGLRELVGFSLVRYSITGTTLPTITLDRPAAVNYSRSSPFRAFRLADGKTVVGGTLRNCNSCNDYSWQFYRFGIDGMIDTSFGVDGHTLINMSNSSLQSMTPLSDGSFVVSGKDRAFFPNTILARLTPSGSLDFTFGTNGQIVVPRGTGLSAVDSQSRIYVSTDEGMKRLLPDGGPDASYHNSNEQPEGSEFMQIDDADRLVIVDGAGIITRLDTSGARDATFNGTGQSGPAGLFTVSIPSDRPGCLATLQAGGAVLIACSVQAQSDGISGAQSNLGIARFTSAGAVDLTFGVTQEDADTFPDALNFAPVTVPFGAANVISAPLPVTGINGRTFIQGTGYSIGCTGQADGGAQTIAAGQTLCLHLNASAVANTSVTNTVNVGGRTATFTVTSTAVPADSVPDAFTFASRNDVATGSTVTSDPVTVLGIEGFTTATVTNGQMDLGCVGNFFTGSVSTVVSGNRICVRHTASANASTTTTTTLTVGGVAGTFSSTTAAPAPPPPPPPSGSSSGGGSSSSSSSGGGGGGGSFDALAIALLLTGLFTRARGRGARRD